MSPRRPHPIARLLERDTLRVVGLMSGTSLDAVDAALVEVRLTPEGDAIAPDGVRLLAFQMSPYTAAERAAIHALIPSSRSDGAAADARALCEGSFALGARFARAAREVVDTAGLQLDELDLVGSHGQTVHHQPPSSLMAGGVAGTLQLGEPAIIAAETGAVTVADFRTADVAVGGEGAPLVPWTDWALHRRPGRVRALQNIGGIANVTLVTEAADDVVAFDNGPGNVMIDALAPLASDGREELDRDGSLSARGRVQEDLLAALLTEEDEYLRRPPPKSTGRERYGRERTLAWAAAHRDRAPVDLLATLVELTARAIADSYRRHLPRMPDEVLVSGGGARNPTLMAALARLLAPIPVRVFGDDPAAADAKEAVAFAVLAVAALRGWPASLPRVTGARRRAVLGKICLPPW
jgi:anhydro-N-acetylmuramic acid kinase